jgi:hypothetical protein
VEHPRFDGSVMRNKSIKRKKSTRRRANTLITLFTHLNVFGRTRKGGIKVQPLSRRERLRKSLELPSSIFQTTAAPAPELSVDTLEELRVAFETWLDSECAVSPRWFGGLSSLHLGFCEWMIARNEVPCDRGTFEALLSKSGFLTGDMQEVRLVSGLALKTDMKAHQAFAKGCE